MTVREPANSKQPSAAAAPTGRLICEGSSQLLLSLPRRGRHCHFLLSVPSLRLSFSSGTVGKSVFFFLKLVGEFYSDNTFFPQCLHFQCVCVDTQNNSDCGRKRESHCPTNWCQSLHTIVTTYGTMRKLGIFAGGTSLKNHNRD